MRLVRDLLGKMMILLNLELSLTVVVVEEEVSSRMEEEVAGVQPRLLLVEVLESLMEEVLQTKMVPALHTYLLYSIRF